MRTLFIGGTRRGYESLRALVNSGADVCGVISLRQHAHEAERYEAAIERLCMEYDVPCVETTAMKDRDYAALLREWAPDIGLCVGCRILIPASIYTIPPRGMLAVHDSLLPKYRGFAPLNWALLNGESETGITLFHLSEGTDNGDIVAQYPIPIGPSETAPELNRRICQLTVAAVLRAWSLPEMPRHPQDETGATYTCSRSPDDGEIDWSQPTARIYDQIRALEHPYPGAYTWLGLDRLYVWRAEVVEDAPPYAGRTPGRVVARNSDSVDVLTADGILRLREVGLAPGERVPASVVLKSVRQTLGLRTADLVAAIADLREQITALQGKHYAHDERC